MIRAQVSALLSQRMPCLALNLCTSFIEITVKHYEKGACTDYSSRDAETMTRLSKPHETCKSSSKSEFQHGVKGACTDCNSCDALICIHCNSCCMYCLFCCL